MQHPCVKAANKQYTLYLQCGLLCMYVAPEGPLLWLSAAAARPSDAPPPAQSDACNRQIDREASMA